MAYILVCATFISANFTCLPVFDSQTCSKLQDRHTLHVATFVHVTWSMQDYPRMVAAQTIANLLPSGARSFLSSMGRAYYSFEHPDQQHSILLPVYILHSLPRSLDAHIVSVTMFRRPVEEHYFHLGLLLELDVAIVTMSNQVPSQWLFIERLDPSEGDSMQMLETSNIYLHEDRAHISGSVWHKHQVTRCSWRPSTVHLTYLFTLMLKLAMDYPYSAWGHNCNWWSYFVYEQLLLAMGLSFTPTPSGKNLPGPTLEFNPEHKRQMPDLRAALHRIMFSYRDEASRAMAECCLRQL